MGDPKWIREAVVYAIHDEQLAEHGGDDGLRDAGLLDSALNRPLNLLAYESSDLYGLAAAYAFGIIKNHPFIDGNKRTSFAATILFLELNGLLIEASDADFVLMWDGLAGGFTTEDQLAQWLRERGKVIR
jgi:death-on-curing protein